MDEATVGEYTDMIGGVGARGGAHDQSNRRGDVTATLEHACTRRWRLSPPSNPCPRTMTLTSADESVSIFQDGKLRPGIYKIQNVAGQTYVDIHDRTHELCCRPATILEEKGLVSSSPPFVKPLNS